MKSFSPSMNTIHIKSPARICLFGDHQDYLNLPVIACAINLNISLSAQENGQEIFNIDLPDIQSHRVISLQKGLYPVTERDYFSSSLNVLKKYNCIANRGYDITIKGNIPVNAGLSSSTAVTTAWMLFLLTAFGSEQTFTPAQIAAMTYEAEVLEHGEPGGMMDQYSIALGGIIYLASGLQPEFHRYNHRFNECIISNSGDKKDTLGLLFEIRTNVEKALTIIRKINNNFTLQKATMADFDHYQKYLPDEIAPFLYAAIQNHIITQKANAELNKKRPNIRLLGQYMNEHHEVLKEQLNITTPKIDAMIDCALNQGAYGAKIVGSGGGGCIVVLAPVQRHTMIIEQLHSLGVDSAIQVDIAHGTHVIESFN